MSLTAADRRYLQTIILPGSNLYYATRVIAEKHQSTQYPLYALYEILHAIPEDCRDPGVARIKLHWWAEQLHAIDTNANAHPLLRILKKSPLETTQRNYCYQTLLNNALNKLQQYSNTHAEESDHMTERYSRSVLTMLFAGIYHTSENRVFSSKLAETIEPAESLLQLGKTQHNKKRHLHAKYILQYFADPSSAHEKILHQAIAETVLYLQNSFKQLITQYQYNKSHYYHLRSEWIYCHLLLKTLLLSKNNYCEILQHAISLTPIRKLWIAFYHS